MNETVVTPSNKPISVRELTRIMYEEYPDQVIDSIQRCIRTGRISDKTKLIHKLRSKGLTVREIMTITGDKSTSVIAHHLNKEV